MATSARKEKKRFHTFIAYPDSLPSDWKEMLEAIRLPMVVSPLHDKDEVEEKKLTPQQKALVQSGQKVYKKPHYHVIYVAKNPVTTDAVRKRIQRSLGVNAVSHVEFVNNIVGLYDYLTHESEEAKKAKKHVYDASELQFIGGFKIEDYITVSLEEKKNLVIELVDIIRSEKFIDVGELYDYLEKQANVEGGIENVREAKFLIFKNPSAFRQFFDSNYRKKQRKESEVVKEYLERVGYFGDIDMGENLPKPNGIIDN